MKWKSKLITIFKKLLLLVAKRIVIKGYSEYCESSTSKRALLSYLVLPILPPRLFRDRVRFGNRGAAQEIARAINELGFKIDIINLDNTTFRVKKKYNLFIGHGGINYEYISRQLPEDTIRIYYSTGPYWKKLNEEEAKRFYELASRRGYFLSPDRAIKDSEDYPLQVADGIITLSDTEHYNAQSKCSIIIKINNGLFPVSWDCWKEKNYEEGRKHFLFFSGDGNVHKGLDVLLEAFVRTDLHLHICQRIDPLFKKVYHHELTKSPNIHLYNFIKMRSPKFEALVLRCNWIISATCGEGQPNSIIECMAYGLIPILPKTANIDLSEGGILLPDCKIETIHSIILVASSISTEECRKRAETVLRNTRTIYSVETFRNNLKESILRVINYKLKQTAIDKI